MVATAPKSFDEPVPASRARSAAQEIIDHNRDEVERSIIEGTRQDLIRILQLAQKQIAKQLKVTNPDATWTVHDLNQTMLLVGDALGHSAPRFRDILARQRVMAYAAGAENTAELLTHFQGKSDNGTIRPLAIREALALKKTALAEHATSVDRYGRYMIGVIRRELQGGIVRGATFHEMTDLLVGRKGPKGVVSLAARVRPDGSVQRLQTARVSKGLFVERRGWAERIVRTEGMRAFNSGANEEIVAQKTKSFPDLTRKLIETFDARTAPDSYVAHGQVRGVTEAFFDGKHTYLKPPGRPNDRACVIPWREVWGGKGGKGGTDEDGELTADELGALAGPAPKSPAAAPAPAPSPAPAPAPAARPPSVLPLSGKLPAAPPPPPPPPPPAPPPQPAVVRAAGYPVVDPRWPVVPTHTGDAGALWKSQVASSYGDVARAVRAIFGTSAPSPDDLARVYDPPEGKVRWRQIYASGESVALSGSIVSNTGATVASITRTFRRVKGELEVEHSLLKFNNDADQSQGAGAAMARNAVRAYIQLGVKRVEVHAHWVGRYTWSSFGYEWTKDEGQSAKAAIIAHLEAAGMSPAHAAREAAQYARLGGNVPLSQLTIGGQPVGKNFFLSKTWPNVDHWEGFLTLDEGNRGFQRAKERLGTYEP